MYKQLHMHIWLKDPKNLQFNRQSQLHIQNEPSVSFTQIISVPPENVILYFYKSPEILQLLLNQITSPIYSDRTKALFIVYNIISDLEVRFSLVKRYNFYANLPFFIKENSDNMNTIINIFNIYAQITNSDSDLTNQFFDFINKNFIDFLNYSPEMLNPYLFFMLNTARQYSQLEHLVQIEFQVVFQFLLKFVLKPQSSITVKFSNAFILLKTLNLLTLTNGIYFLLDNKALQLVNLILRKQKGPQLVEVCQFILQISQLLDLQQIGILIANLNLQQINRMIVCFKVFNFLLEALEDALNNNYDRVITCFSAQQIQNLLIQSKFTQTYKLFITKDNVEDISLVFARLKEVLRVDCSSLFQD